VDTVVIVIVVACVIVTAQLDSVITVGLEHADRVVDVVGEVEGVDVVDVVGTRVEEIDVGVAVTTQEQAELILKDEDEHLASQFGNAVVGVSTVARYGVQNGEANVG
jgi:hypothetical protein